MNYLNNYNRHLICVWQENRFNQRLWEMKKKRRRSMFAALMGNHHQHHSFIATVCYRMELYRQVERVWFLSHLWNMNFQPWNWPLIIITIHCVYRFNKFCYDGGQGGGLTNRRRNTIFIIFKHMRLASINRCHTI